MPIDRSSRAAARASSLRSPGMNLRTDRRTNAALVARSRSHGLVDPASRIFLITLIHPPAHRTWHVARGTWHVARDSHHALHQPAVHLQGRARDIAGGVRQQERGDPAVLLDL